MPKRSSKPKKPGKDVNTLAKAILDAVTGETEEPTDEKDPAAVALGRKGGLVGGKARAAALSKKKRSEIAKIAAGARWKKSPG